MQNLKHKSSTEVLLWSSIRANLVGRAGGETGTAPAQDLEPKWRTSVRHFDTRFGQVTGPVFHHTRAHMLYHARMHSTASDNTRAPPTSLGLCLCICYMRFFFVYVGPMPPSMPVTYRMGAAPESNRITPSGPHGISGTQPTNRPPAPHRPGQLAGRRRSGTSATHSRWTTAPDPVSLCGLCDARPWSSC